jgi:hypothetical protein
MKNRKDGISTLKKKSLKNSGAFLKEHKNTSSDLSSKTDKTRFTITNYA